MAELILTDEEKAAALWGDLDDAALGKLVKKKIAFLTNAAEQLDRVTTFAAAMILCCSAAEQNASEVAFEIDGLTQAGREFGDWKIVAMKTANVQANRRCAALSRSVQRPKGARLSAGLGFAVLVKPQHAASWLIPACT